MRPPAYASCVRWPSKYMRTGSRPCSTSTWIRCRNKRKKPCAGWETRREGFYETDQGKALKCRPRPGPRPASKAQSDPLQFAELDMHNFLDRSLVRWAYKKYKKLRGHLRGATHWIARISRRE